MSDLGTVSPGSFSEAAAVLAAASARQRPVRIAGGATKLSWGGAPPTGALWLKTSRLSRVTVHEGAQTATVLAGTTMARAQSVLAGSGVMLAADPHLGLRARPQATVGGVVATADGGPLSHAYGPVRDQVVGLTAALSDGSILHTGVRSVQEQEGYDLSRLLIGSFGTLGLILAVDVRLHPLPTVTATAVGSSRDAAALRESAAELTGRHGELQALDIAWREGHGGLLAQVAGEDSPELADAVAATMRRCGLDDVAVSHDDGALWARQRGSQRSADQAVLLVRARPSALAGVLRLADAARATVVGRAALGHSYLALPVGQIATVRAGLPDDASAVVLDLPARAHGTVDPWDVADSASLLAMRHVKARFDPGGICNPGVFVGEI